MLYYPRSGSPELEFNTLEELLALETLQTWVKMDDFRRFSKSGRYLMAELREGRTWWVIGSLDDPDNVDLPVWEAVYVKEDRVPDEPGSYWATVDVGGAKTTTVAAWDGTSWDLSSFISIPPELLRYAEVWSFKD